jgi:hypothetical protein
MRIVKIDAVIPNVNIRDRRLERPRTLPAHEAILLS